MKVDRNPRISIITPCYNVADYLQLTLQSISEQPVGDVEYIFVNDGSSDGTLDMLNIFCADKPYCKVINQSNAGVSAARNAALDIAAGDYIYLLDGDDILTYNSISMMLKSIEDNTADLVLSEVTVLKDGVEQREKLSIKAGEYTPDDLYCLYSVFPTKPQLLYKQSLIKNNNLRFNTDIRLGEVYEFTIRVLAKSSNIRVTGDCFFYYVMRSSSATHKPNYATDLTVIDTLEQYEIHGEGLKKHTSFYVTAFKMLMSFTYNKYAKLGLSDKTTLNTIRTLLLSPVVKKYLKIVAFSTNVSLKERCLALYIITTRIFGYRIISKLLRQI